MQGTPWALQIETDNTKGMIMVPHLTEQLIFPENL
jgi:hypothetical protein